MLLCLFPRGHPADGTEGTRECPSQSLREVTKATLQMRVKPEEPPRVLVDLAGLGPRCPLRSDTGRVAHQWVPAEMSSRSSLISKMHAESDLGCLSSVPHSWRCRQNPEERHIVHAQLPRSVGRRASLLSLIS